MDKNETEGNEECEIVLPEFSHIAIKQDGNQRDE